MERKQVEELLYQALETERGGIRVYEAAVRCARNDDLKKEWGEYLEQTRNHEVVMLRVLDAFGLEPETATPGREIVRRKGETLVASMESALQADPKAAQLVAAECVVEAETKDHMNWELIGEVSQKLTGEEAKVLKQAHSEVEEEEDEHLYHTMGWAREPSVHRSARACAPTQKHQFRLIERRGKRRHEERRWACASRLPDLSLTGGLTRPPARLLA